MRLLVFLVLLLAPALCEAHDLDCKGNPVPTKIKQGCCGAGDALQLQPGQWRGDDEHGYEVFIDGDWRPVVEKSWMPDGKLGNPKPIRALPSEDGCEWVWYRRVNTQTGLAQDHYGDGPFNFYCLQLNMSF